MWVTADSLFYLASFAVSFMHIYLVFTLLIHLYNTYVGLNYLVYDLIKYIIHNKMQKPAVLVSEWVVA